MLHLFPLFLAATLSVQPKDSHDNPLFRELTKVGLDVGARAKILLPAPTMEDGLDAAGQKKVLQTLIEGSYEFDEFVRNSVVAPNILRTRDIEPSNPQAPAKGADFWFIAYGDWNKLADRDFMQRTWNTSPKETRGKILGVADLARRKITIPPGQVKFLNFGTGTVSLFNKVQVSGTGYSLWSKSASSYILAGKLDPRFLKDAEFPNQWRSMKKDDDGNLVLGPPQPYQGAGYYMKATRLAEPAGAIFVEGHVIFCEPVGWFDGANFLRSKLPIAVQTQVRAFRRELLKVSVP